MSEQPVALITGTTRGIGMVTARAVAAAGYRLLMGCRNAQRGELVRDHLVRATGNTDVEVVTLNLASQRSVTACVAQVLGRTDTLQLLVNNAGMMSMTRELSEDGVELTFATNHLGPFLLTELLLGRLKASAPARIVNVASRAHLRGRLDPDTLLSQERYRPMAAYARSKLATVVYTLELARRLEGTGVTVNCLHPGVVATNILPGGSRPLEWVAGVAKRFMLSPEQGAASTIHLALAAELEGVTGGYFDQHRRQAEPAPAARDADLQARLYRFCARLTGLDQSSGGAPS